MRKIKTTWHPPHRWAEMSPSMKRIVARRRGNIEAQKRAVKPKS